MKHFEIKGQVREAGSKTFTASLRRQGLVPCNLYGQGTANVLFTVNARDLKGITHTPSSYILDVVLDNGQTFTAIVHELQWHPISDECLHVDFLVVSEDKPVSIEVPVNISGHAAGVQAGGKFVQLKRKLRVSAMMKDLPDELGIDISHLQIGQNIVAGELSYDNVTILTPKSTIICGVKATRQSAAAAAAAK